MKFFNLIGGTIYRSPLRLLENEDPIKQARDLGYHRGRSGDLRPAPPGTNIEAYNAGYAVGKTAAKHHAAGLMHNEPAPSGPHPDYYDSRKLREQTSSPYYGTDRSTPIASSRTTRAASPSVTPGSWKIDDMKLNHGRFIEQLGVFNPKDLDPSEFDWNDPKSSLRYEGRDADAARYAEWIKAGHEPPPINVVQHENGSLKVTDGHRRLYAAHLAGAPVKAWVSWNADHPQGVKDWQGNVLKTGLTHEIAAKSGLPPGIRPDGDYTQSSDYR